MPGAASTKHTSEFRPIVAAAVPVPESDRRTVYAHEAAAANGDNHRVKAGELVHDLEAAGSLPCYYTLVVKRRYEFRAALYRKLDDIKDEVELQKFTTEVTDRFGPIPQQVVELMEAIRLRWLGQQIGLEKMVLKKGVLIGTFIADQKHPFFASDTFHSVLRAVQAQPRKFKVYEKGGTLRVSVQDVKNVREAKGALESVVGTTLQTA